MKVLALELVKLILEKRTGLFIFQNNEGGHIRVYMINGKIYNIEGMYGDGKTELSRLFIWHGDVIERPLPKDFIPKEEIEPPGFYKVLIWKATQSKKETKYDVIFDNLKYKIMEGFDCLKLEFEKGLFLDLDRIVEILRFKGLENNVIIMCQEFIAFMENGEILGIYSKDGFIDYEKAKDISDCTVCHWRIYEFPEEKFKEILKSISD